jgi:hypothetical protein
MPRHALIAILALASLASLASAQTTEGQAVKAARTAAKAELAALKLAVKDARDLFLADVAAVEATFKDGAGTPGDLDGLFDSAVALQVAVQEAVLVASVNTAFGIENALSGLADGADLNGGYPEPLQVGTSGVIDDARAAIDKLLAKTYAALDKRLNKTEAIVEAAGALHLRASILPPYGSLPFAASEGTHNSLHAGLGIDVIVALREDEQLLGGIVHLAGSDAQAEIGDGLEVHAYFMDADDTLHFAGPAIPGDERWQATMNGLPRGSYISYVQTEGVGGSPFRSTGFGLP